MNASLSSQLRFSQKRAITGCRHLYQTGVRTEARYVSRSLSVQIWYWSLGLEWC